MKKKNIIIVILILVVGVYAVFKFTKKTPLKYTTAEVSRGNVIQTVSATGTIDADTKLDLRFVNSGKISQINVKVGDYIKKGNVLAKLDTTQLKSQLSKANANLNAARANLDKIVAGAKAEDIKVSETMVENAQIALDNATQNLFDTKKNMTKNIENAESSVNSAQIALDNANQSQSNIIISNENNLNQNYEDAWDIINSSLLTASDSLNTNKTTLDYKDAQDTLSVLSSQYLNDSNQSKVIAENSYNSVKNYTESIKSNPTHQEIDKALTETKSMLEDIRNTLGDTNNVLQATITSSKLSQTELDSLKADISSTRIKINTAISNITTEVQNISARKITNQTNLDNAQATINSAKSTLNVSQKSLALAKSSADIKINASENAIKSAKGALKQAQDQLALKKAGPSSSEILLYKSQVSEARANVNLIKNQIDDSILIAPQDGIVTEVNGKVGEIVTTTEKFVSIIAPGNFEIEANISEVDIAKIKIGDKVKITFDALGPDKKFDGLVIKIDPAQTEISGVIYYKVTAIFSGDAKIVKPGMTSNLDIMTAHKDNVIMIPFQALKEKDGQKYAQILENNIAKDIPIKVGLEGDVNLEILDGLKEGQKVVTFVEK